jgi:methionine sulfoxide reductase heme-binding subunit
MFGKHLNSFFFLLFIVATALLPCSSSQALVKDSDADGLTDQAETEVYLTDPMNPDTDDDGVSDSDEILAGTSPLSTESHPAQTIEENIMEMKSFAWFFGRASGILAFILLSIVVGNGLLMTTRLVFRLLPPALNYEMHRFFAWMALLTVIGHLVSFTFDEYFHLTFSEGLVPFVLTRDFSSSLGFDLRYAVGIGTVAFYGILTLIISSELKGKFLSIKKWRVLHYSSFLTYLLFLVHGIIAGTDTATWWMIWLYSVSAIIVFGLTGLRIFAVIQKRRSTFTPPSQPMSTPPAAPTDTHL